MCCDCPEPFFFFISLVLSRKVIFGWFTLGFSMVLAGVPGFYCMLRVVVSFVFEVEVVKLSPNRSPLLVSRLRQI